MLKLKSQLIAIVDIARYILKQNIETEMPNCKQWLFQVNKHLNCAHTHAQPYIPISELSGNLNVPNCFPFPEFLLISQLSTGCSSNVHTT